MEDKSVNIKENDEQAQKLVEQEKRDQAQWKKTKRTFGGLLRVILWCVIVAVLVFLTLYISARIAQFNSINDMLRFIFGHF